MSELEHSAMNERDGAPADRGNLDVPSELKSVEAKLATLSPRQDRLDRDRLIFLAGQASFADTERLPRTVFGLNETSWAWPGAFAAMTALAATLLVMLVTRPEIVVHKPSLPTGIAPTDNMQFTADRRDRRTVLCTMDVHLGDIEQMLAKKDFTSPDIDTASTTDENRSAGVLTPGRWPEVLHESESSHTSSKGASNHRLIRGATS